MQQSTNYGFGMPESTDAVDVSVLSQNFQSADGVIHRVSESTAPDFDSDETYAVGAFVMYESKLFRCTTAHSGEWDASDFEQTDVTSEMKLSLTYDSGTRKITIPDSMGSYNNRKIIFTH